MAVDPKNILIIDGHPDAREGRFVHALACAYREAATGAGHTVRTLSVATLKFPWLQTSDDFRKGEPPPVIRDAQESLVWAQHVVILYPLWLGSMPSLLKAFLEQVLRPGFAFGAARQRGLPKKLLAGRSARVIITMGMPGPFYRIFYRAHSLKSLERNILRFVGFAPVRSLIIGGVEILKPVQRRQHLDEVRELGRRAL
ncbi:MAG: NAD(P)H-dependent oxidoreductase [Gammaproteobacteria bacterium]|nr:NAD(P)H-dependent oxidoreductase [Gammaproteobacteria bacterium]